MDAENEHQLNIAPNPHTVTVHAPPSSGLPELDRRQLIQVCKYLKENTTLSAKDIAKAYQVSLRTMYRWLAMPDPPDNSAPILRKAGKPPKCSLELEDEIFQWLVEEPSRRQIDAVRMVQERHGVTITQQTVSNILKRHGDTSVRLAASGGLHHHGGVALLGMAATAQPLYQQSIVMDPSEHPAAHSFVVFQQLHGTHNGSGDVGDHDAASAAAAAAAAMQAAAAAGALINPGGLGGSDLDGDDVVDRDGVDAGAENEREREVQGGVPKEEAEATTAENQKHKSQDDLKIPIEKPLKMKQGTAEQVAQRSSDLHPKHNTLKNSPMLSGRDKDRDDADGKKKKGLFAGMFGKKQGKDDSSSPPANPQLGQATYHGQPQHPPEASSQQQQYSQEYTYQQSPPRQHGGGWTDSQNQEYAPVQLTSASTGGFRMPAMAKKNRNQQQAYGGYEEYVSAQRVFHPPYLLAMSPYRTKTGPGPQTPSKVNPSPPPFANSPSSSMLPPRVIASSAVPSGYPQTAYSEYSSGSLAQPYPGHPPRGISSQQIQQPNSHLPVPRPPGVSSSAEEFVGGPIPPPRRPPNLRQLGPPLAALAAQRAHPSPDSSSPAHLTPPLPPLLNINQPPSPNFAAFPSVPPSPLTPFLPPAPPPTPTSFRPGSVPPSPVVLPSSAWGLGGTPPSSLPGSAASSAPASPARVAPPSGSASASLASVEEEEEIHFRDASDEIEDRSESLGREAVTNARRAVPNIQLESLKIDLGSNFSDLGYFPGSDDNLGSATNKKQSPDETPPVPARPTRSSDSVVDDSRQVISSPASSTPSVGNVPVAMGAREIELTIEDDEEIKARERKERLSKMGGVSVFGGGPLPALRRFGSGGASVELGLGAVKSADSSNSGSDSSAAQAKQGHESPPPVVARRTGSLELQVGSSSGVPPLEPSTAGIVDPTDASTVTPPGELNAEEVALKVENERRERASRIARMGGVGVMGGMLPVSRNKTEQDVAASDIANSPQLAGDASPAPASNFVPEALTETLEVYDPSDPVEEAKRAREDRMARLARMGKIKVRPEGAHGRTTSIDQGKEPEAMKEEAAPERVEEEDLSQKHHDEAYDPQEFAEAKRAREERIARLARMGKIKVIGDNGLSRTGSVEHHKQRSASHGVEHEKETSAPPPTAVTLDQQTSFSRNSVSPAAGPVDKQPLAVTVSVARNDVSERLTPVTVELATEMEDENIEPAVKTHSLESPGAFNPQASTPEVEPSVVGVPREPSVKALSDDVAKEETKKDVFAGIVAVAEVKASTAAKSRIALKARKHSSVAPAVSSPASEPEEVPESLQTVEAENDSEAVSEIEKQTPVDKESLLRRIGGVSMLGGVSLPTNPDVLSEETVRESADILTASLTDDQLDGTVIEETPEDQEAKRAAERAAKLARLGGRNVFGGMGGVQIERLKPKPRSVPDVTEHVELKDPVETVGEKPAPSFKTRPPVPSSKPVVPPKPVKRTPSEELVEHEIDTSTYNPNFHLPTKVIGQDLETQVVEWIESVVGEQKGERTTQEWLKDGTVLCKLVNGVGGKASMRSGKFRMVHMENIRNYVEATSVMGNKYAKFEPNDLYEGANMLKVFQHIESFRALTTKKASKTSSRGPPNAFAGATSSLASVASTSEATRGGDHGIIAEAMGEQATSLLDNVEVVLVSESSRIPLEDEE
ncbi:hypothetical protein HDU93_005136 [Gonapodya sp. JEL0774]|nr:hypothetical protein HDU93_005136 [Gonapodya sp. JEL0774]